MKKYLIGMFILGLTGSFQANAQMQLTGPAAKNRKMGDNTQSNLVFHFIRHNHPPLTGPLAKNSNRQKDTCTALILELKVPRLVQGPEAKNIHRDIKPERDAR